jgi:hypothetical protein
VPLDHSSLAFFVFIGRHWPETEPAFADGIWGFALIVTVGATWEESGPLTVVLGTDELGHAPRVVFVGASNRHPAIRAGEGRIVPVSHLRFAFFTFKSEDSTLGLRQDRRSLVAFLLVVVVRTIGADLIKPVPFPLPNRQPA